MDSRLAAYIAVLPPQPRQGLADSPDGRFWPEASFWQQMRAGGLVSRLGVLLGTHAFEVALVFASWAFLGSGALSGRLDYCVAGSVGSLSGQHRAAARRLALAGGRRGCRLRRLVETTLDEPRPDFLHLTVSP